MTDLKHRLFTICRMVKIEHSIFALPFAFIGAFLASDGRPSLFNLLVLTVAMVAVRSFAMAVNRLVDLDIDRENPRTQSRPLVTGELSTGFTAAFIAGTGIVFIGCCALLNPLCLALSVPALVWSAFYSVTKRFTWGCHFFLGSVLALAPLAGWISQVPVFTLAAVLFFCGVLFWVAGFDILYSCQDIQFDRRRGLHSVPAVFGIETALALSAFSHAVTGVFFVLAGWAAGLGWAYFAVAIVCCGFLAWEHTLIRPDDMSRVNLAFFTVNGFVAVAVFAGVLLGLYM